MNSNMPSYIGAAFTAFVFIGGCIFIGVGINWEAGLGIGLVALASIIKG